MSRVSGTEFLKPLESQDWGEGLLYANEMSVGLALCGLVVKTNQSMIRGWEPIFSLSYYSFSNLLTFIWPLLFNVYNINYSCKWHFFSSSFLFLIVLLYTDGNCTFANFINSFFIMSKFEYLQFFQMNSLSLVCCFSRVVVVFLC